MIKIENTKIRKSFSGWLLSIVRVYLALPIPLLFVSQGLFGFAYLMGGYLTQGSIWKKVIYSSKSKNACSKCFIDFYQQIWNFWTWCAFWNQYIESVAIWEKWVLYFSLLYRLATCISESVLSLFLAASRKRVGFFANESSL